ncbi:hypothetical protein GA0070621_5086 [Micromonospora narathiwatensis]|uniref:Beta/Gamma crystallin n=1 Tax=Micromonospora narathiwatensis TaxID=299146 RepID=A0A1A9ABR0_9ACTN|nr:hypothetical protein GA0070621_5086 [Micromonospora narathiwatensis]
MRFSTKAIAALGTMLVGLASSLVLATTPASAATSCYDGAVSVSYNQADADDWRGTRGPYTTSSRCADINFKLTGVQYSRQYSVGVCVMFNSSSNPCNYYTWFSSTGTWKTIATNVYDGTKFYIYIQGQAGGLITGQLAY